MLGAVTDLKAHDDSDSETWTLESTVDEDGTPEMDSDLDVLAGATYESEGSGMEGSEDSDYRF